jgi:serine/threonine protein kinase
MGVVHLAVDPQGRNVAIKVLRPGVASDQTALRRLAREVDSMRRVHSPHVAEILDADVTAEPPYVVTQFVPGRTLEQTVRDHGPLRGHALQRLAGGLAKALTAIHGAGIIHRDLKPGNVMFLDNGEPVVIDFGIAQGVDATRLTATGLVIGTPGYLAPEIIEGEDAGAPADVHSWASTVAFAATGRAPFGSGTFESIFYKIMEGRPDLDGVPESMLPLIRAAMARNPAERPTAHALVDLTTRIDLDRTRFDRPAPQAGPRTKPLTAVAAPPLASPRDFRGQLPPVPPQPPPPLYGGPPPVPTPQAQSPYAPPPASAPHERRPDLPAKPEGPKPYGLYRLLSLLLLLGALGLDAMLPSIAVIVVLIAVLLLRVADRAHRDLTAKRTRRGPRPADVVGVIVKSPFSLVRAGLTVMLFSPIGVLAGIVALVFALAAKSEMTITRALTLSAGAFIVVVCLGPGSEPPRRQLARMWGSIAPRRDRALVVVGVVGLLVFFLVSFGLSQAPDLRPFAFAAFDHDLSHLRHGIRDLFGD